MFEWIVLCRSQVKWDCYTIQKSAHSIHCSLPQMVKSMPVWKRHFLPTQAVSSKQMERGMCLPLYRGMEMGVANRRTGQAQMAKGKGNLLKWQRDPLKSTRQFIYSQVLKWKQANDFAFSHSLFIWTSWNSLHWWGLRSPWWHHSLHAVIVGLSLSQDASRDCVWSHCHWLGFSPCS